MFHIVTVKYVIILRRTKCQEKCWFCLDKAAWHVIYGNHMTTAQCYSSFFGFFWYGFYFGPSARASVYAV